MDDILNEKEIIGQLFTVGQIVHLTVKNKFKNKFLYVNKSFLKPNEHVFMIISVDDFSEYHHGDDWAWCEILFENQMFHIRCSKNDLLYKTNKLIKLSE